MKAAAPLAAAFALATVALATQAQVSTDGELAGASVTHHFTIVNNTTTPANSSVAEGTLRYSCGGMTTLTDLAKDQSANLECDSSSVLYRVPGELGPHRLDFSCAVTERQTFTFSGSGSGVSAQPSCSALDSS